MSEDSKDSFKGSCKKCPATVKGSTGKEAVAAAMKHGKEAHGNAHLGFRWGRVAEENRRAQRQPQA